MSQSLIRSLDATHAQLAALELQLAEREVALDALKLELHELQSRYLGEIGVFFKELSQLEAKVEHIEVRLGLRPPPIHDEAEEENDADVRAAAGCSNPAAPSDDLKRMFRDVAKAIHPDLALDEPARCRRHSLMAEANRAYADRDEDRLRLILRAWERNPEADVEDDPEAAAQRVPRRIAAIDARLIAIEGEFAGLRRSAIWRLKGRIDDARQQGWDMFAEMILTVKRDITRASQRLAKLEREQA